MDHFDSTVVGRVDVFSTSPCSTQGSRADYVRNVADVARWSEDAGCRGMLIYTDNSLADPWLVSQIVIQSTRRLCPLVAVQPLYMHPYAVAKMVSSLAHLYGRQIYLNMVAGGFANDLAALDDKTPHDRRYDRLIEYTTVIQRLLSSPAPVTFEGEFHRVKALRMTPPLPPELMPGIFISGSSEAGVSAARRLGVTAVKYPKPAGEEGAEPRDGLDAGVRVGLIARANADDAWTVAHARFPVDRKGQLAHQLAMKTSDSQWHRQLSEMGERAPGEANPYWLVPFQNYKTFCPYLVGSHGRVADELARYMGAGYRKFILDIPPDREDLSHIRTTFELALQQVNA